MSVCLRLVQRRWSRFSLTWPRPQCLFWPSCQRCRCGATSRRRWTRWRPTGPTRSAGTPLRLCCWRCALRGLPTRCPPSGTWWGPSGPRRTGNTRRCSGTWPGSFGRSTWNAWCPGATAWGGGMSPLCTPWSLTVSGHVPFSFKSTNYTLK